MKHETKFKKKVLNIVKEIPKGQIMSYHQVAKAAGSPRAFRAVGNILAENRDPKIPCHRVIKTDGKIGGYRWGRKKKINLLQKEGVVINIENQEPKIKDKYIKR